MTPACPITAAQDALTLLRSGRAAMAVSVLERLPALIEAQLVEARGAGFAEGWDAHLLAAARERQQAVLRPAPSAPAPRTPTRLDWLRDALADPAKRECARAALRMDNRLLDRIAAGTVTLSGTHWRRLREALA